MAAEPPLRVGVTPGTPPFVVQGAGGQLFRLYGGTDARGGSRHAPRHHLHGGAPPRALIDDLAADRIDMLGGPLMATPESAAGLLFTEGYLWTEYQFGSRAETPVTKLADLRGKRLAVVADSEYSGWAARNAAKLGFTVVSEPHAGDVFDAVRRGDADASLTGSPGCWPARWAPTRAAMAIATTPGWSPAFPCPKRAARMPRPWHKPAANCATNSRTR